MEGGRVINAGDGESSHSPPLVFLEIGPAPSNFAQHRDACHRERATPSFLDFTESPRNCSFLHSMRRSRQTSQARHNWYRERSIKIFHGSAEGNRSGSDQQPRRNLTSLHDSTSNHSIRPRASATTTAVPTFLRTQFRQRRQPWQALSQT